MRRGTQEATDTSIDIKYDLVECEKGFQQFVELTAGF